MDHTQEDVQRILQERAQKVWDDEQRPYLLSDVGSDMKARGIDYRSILGEERLKAFIERTQDAGGYNVVQHPRQTAKIGIVPAGVSYRFPDEAASEHRPESPSGDSARQGKAIVEFLRALSRLPDADQDSVVIPVRIITKLFGIR